MSAINSCPGCGARLRRDRRPGEQCDPCLRKGPRLGLPPGPRLVLPPGFFDQTHLAAALAALEFGPVFLAVRAHTRWSQQALGEYVDIDQCRISDIENGRRQLSDLRTVVRVANRLQIPAGALGFVHGVTVGKGIATGRRGEWMDRRDFVQHVTSVAFAGLAGGTLDIDRLCALLDPDSDETRTRQSAPLTSKPSSG